MSLFNETILNLLIISLSLKKTWACVKHTRCSCGPVVVWVMTVVCQELSDIVVCTVEEVKVGGWRQQSISTWHKKYWSLWGLLPRWHIRKQWNDSFFMVSTEKQRHLPPATYAAIRGSVDQKEDFYFCDSFYLVAKPNHKLVAMDETVCASYSVTKSQTEWRSGRLKLSPQHWTSTFQTASQRWFPFKHKHDCSINVTACLLL